MISYFPPLKDRLTTIDFEPYEYSELGQILQTKVPDVNFTADALYQISKTTRGNARNAVMRAKEIMLFCEAENCPNFDGASFEKFCDTLGILPHGITCTEKQILANSCGERCLHFINAIGIYWFEYDLNSCRP